MGVSVFTPILRKKNMAGRDDLVATARAQFDRVTGDAPFLSVVFVLNDDGRLDMHETTVEFPFDAHDDVLRMLRAALDAKVPDPIVLDPLPLADHLFDNANLPDGDCVIGGGLVEGEQGVPHADSQ